MTISLLQAYDSAIVSTKLHIQTATSVTYCVDSTVGGTTWNKNGPGADLVTHACTQGAIVEVRRARGTAPFVSKDGYHPIEGYLGE